MIDLNLYRSPSSPDDLVLVPELLGTVQSDLRQVVRVIVEGESPKAKVVVDKIVNEVDSEGRTSRLSSVEAFVAAVGSSSPAVAEAADALCAKLSEMAAKSDGRLAFALQRSSANLYWVTPAGSRRFIAVRTDGRFRIILRYLRSAGITDVIDRVVEAVAPTLALTRDDRTTGTRITPQNVQSLLALLDRIELVLLGK